MKLVRKETLATLEPLKPALQARSAVQELGHIWFDGAYAYASNGGIGIRVKFTAPMKCGVPGGLLLGLLDKTAGDSMEFEVADGNLIYKSGRSSVKLATLPFERRLWRYPDKPEGKPQATIKTSEEFLDALKRVFVLKPSAPKRMEHHAVCVFAEGKEMDIYVTDSKSLVVMPVKAPIVGSLKKLALPRELAEQLVSKAGVGKELKAYTDHFRIDASDKVSLFSNVFDTSEMLDLPGVADKHSDDRAAPPFVLPAGFKAALERAVLLAGADEPTIQLKVSGKSFKIAGRFKFGQLDEELTLTAAAGKAASISLDARTTLGVGDVNEMSISGSAANLRHKDSGFMYILSAKDGPRDQTVRSQPPSEDESED